MSNGLDEALKAHVSEFIKIHSVDPSNLDFLDGGGCLRVCVYASDFPERMLDIGYLPLDFGFDSIVDLRIAAGEILKRDHSLKYKTRRTTADI